MKVIIRGHVIPLDAIIEVERQEVNGPNTHLLWGFDIILIGNHRISIHKHEDVRIEGPKKSYDDWTQEERDTYMHAIREQHHAACTKITNLYNKLMSVWEPNLRFVKLTEE